MAPKFDSIKKLSLDSLDLDASNPRFGMSKGHRSNQTDILDYIVTNFTVDDVISSLAYNGYFDAEPLIAKDEGNGRYTVIEGNRRLAACLILAGSDRAKNQKRRTEEFAKIAKVPWSNNTKVPVHVFEKGHDPAKLHSYLGVRHITSSKAWDSYAKAAWIDDVVSKGEMTLDQICEVTGDKNKTIQRLLEGYNFVNQLVSEGVFSPEDSIRKGRGSNPEFPFSWVYTLLNYAAVREWLEIEGNDPVEKKPVKAHRIEDAASTMVYLFGDRSSGRNSSIRDSRQIGQLAFALGSPSKRDMLRKGKSIEEIEDLSRAPIDQLANAIEEAGGAFSQALKIVGAGGLTEKEIIDVIPKAREAANIGVSVYKSLQALGEPSMD